MSASVVARGKQASRTHTDCGSATSEPGHIGWPDRSFTASKVMPGGGFQRLNSSRTNGCGDSRYALAELSGWLFTAH